MSSISLHDKALTHLFRYRFTRPEIEFGAPFEISQDGVATALRISRSHASIILKKMVDSGELEVTHSYVKSTSKPVKRMIYHVTEKGKSVYHEREEDLRSDGIDITKILDDSFDRDRLTDETMNFLGCMSVIRTTVFYSELDKRIPNVSCRPNGEAYIKDSVKHLILSESTDADRRLWHSLAADWCLDHHRKVSDRLFHLINAHRDREALCILKSEQTDVLMLGSPDISTAIFILAKRRKDIELMKIAARMALDSKDLDKASEIAAAISSIRPSESINLKAEILFLRGLYADAIDILERKPKDWESEMLTGMCLYGLNRYDEAGEKMRNTRNMMLENGCVSRIDVLLGYETLIRAKLNNVDNASTLIEAAISMSRDRRKRSDLIAVRDRVRSSSVSENRVLLQCVDV